MRPPQKKTRGGRAYLRRMLPWANWPSVYNMNQKNTELYIKAYQRGNMIEESYIPHKVRFFPQNPKPSSPAHIPRSFRPSLSS